MTSATANNVSIEYEEFGEPRDPAILLIMGFAAQMVVWPDAFCQALADRSFRVIRFDNRDAGLSTHLDGVTAPGMKRSMLASMFGIKLKVPYTLADMALDLKAANLLTMEAAWKYDQGTVTDADMAMAKLKASEMLAFVADEAIQIHGGMGVMDELPLERIWRDARIERIWEGTSEIQRHIISRELLRPLGG